MAITDIKVPSITIVNETDNTKKVTLTVDGDGDLLNNGAELVGSGSGEVNTASNLGSTISRIGVYSNKVGVDLKLKSLVAGSNITLTEPVSGEILIGSTGGSGEVNTASNLGSGSGIYSSKVGSDLRLKSLVAGSNIILTGDSNTITINSSSTNTTTLDISSSSISFMNDHEYLISASQILNVYRKRTFTNDSILISDLTGITSKYNGIYIRVGSFNSKSYYRNDNGELIWWDSTKWNIGNMISSTEDVSLPNMVVTWVGDTPTVADYDYYDKSYIFNENISESENVQNEITHFIIDVKGTSGHFAKYVGTQNTTPIMTSNTTPSGEVTASSYWGVGYEPYRAFDHIIGTSLDGWFTTTLSFPQAYGDTWLKYDFGLGNEKTITKYVIYCRTDSNVASPSDWTFEGSGNNIDWIILDTQSNQFPEYLSGDSNEYFINNKTSYRYYRIVITNKSDPSASYVGFDELELHEDVFTRQTIGSGNTNPKVVTGSEFILNNVNTIYKIQSITNNGENDEEVSFFENPWLNQAAGDYEVNRIYGSTISSAGAITSLSSMPIPSNNYYTTIVKPFNYEGWDNLRSIVLNGMISSDNVYALTFDNLTYKIYTGSAWRSIVSNQNSVHGLTDNQWAYIDSTTDVWTLSNAPLTSTLSLAFESGINNRMSQLVLEALVQADYASGGFGGGFVILSIASGMFNTSPYSNNSISSINISLSSSTYYIDARNDVVIRKISDQIYGISRIGVDTSSDFIIYYLE